MNGYGNAAMEIRSKKELRQIYKARRAQLGHDNRLLLSAEITKQALAFLSERETLRHIHLFLSIAKLHEIDTYPLVDALQKQGKKVYTSVIDPMNGQMKTVKLVSGGEIGLDAWGIPVPVVREEVLEDLLQVVFLPLLAYDLNGHRIGYGKGMYDRFAAQLSHGVLKVGLSFFPPETSIPSEKHDVRLDFCINPEGVISFKH